MRAIARSIRLLVVGASLATLMARLAARPSGLAAETPSPSLPEIDECPRSRAREEVRAARAAAETRMAERLDRDDAVHRPPAIHPPEAVAARSPPLDDQQPPPPLPDPVSGVALVALGGA